jgi:hypothetical protein
MFEITNQEFAKLVAASKNWTELARRCGVFVKKKMNETLMSTLKQKVSNLGLSTSHFGYNFERRRAQIYGIVPAPDNDVFVENGIHQRRLLTKRLFELDFKEECTGCKNTHFVVDNNGVLTWQGKQIVLQLEHKNGHNTDNRMENLEFLCPSCHSQTSTYCCRKRIEPHVRELVDDNELRKRVSECTSWRAVCLYGGGSYFQAFGREFQVRAKLLGLDTSHFVLHPKQHSNEDVFVENRLCSGYQINNVCWTSVGKTSVWVAKIRTLFLIVTTSSCGMRKKSLCS